ncbi:UNVERIFIED_CONTAM: hypothetical protein FKN15_034446 [Acipenser sinensis]
MCESHFFVSPAAVCLSHHYAGSQRISDSDISDYDVADGIGVVSTAAECRSNNRESKSTTLTVPEQQRRTHHRSRSVSPHRGDDQGRTRSRIPSVPLQRSLDEIHQSRRSHSPTRNHAASRSPIERRSRDIDSQYFSEERQSRTLDRSSSYKHGRKDTASENESGAARSVLSSGTIGLVALLWICSAKNDGLAGARFGGRVFQPPFPESAGWLRAPARAKSPRKARQKIQASYMQVKRCMAMRYPVPDDINTVLA